ncbi:MAG: hypothetical protein ACOCV8_01310 [Spirochaetota bacterium]
MKYKKHMFLLLILLLIFLSVANVYARDTIYRPAMFTLGKYYQADSISIPEEELSNYVAYAEVIYNSKGKLLEEKIYVSGILTCKRIYSPRFDKVLREENYIWDKDGNKTIYETKNYYGEKGTFREKTITSAVFEGIHGEREALYVEYELFSVINDIECKRIKQKYKSGKLQHTLIYYYDEDGTIIIVEERNVDNVIIRLGRPDYSRLIIGIGDINEAIVWKNAEE